MHDCGPVFGGGWDIKIVDQCNIGRECTSYIYSFKKCVYTDEKEAEERNSQILIGYDSWKMPKFSVSEYEVFKIV